MSDSPVITWFNIMQHRIKHGNEKCSIKYQNFLLQKKIYSSPMTESYGMAELEKIKVHPSPTVKNAIQTSENFIIYTWNE